jgi:hypothetical protein
MPATQLTKRNFRGIELLDNWKQNKGTALTDEKREQLDLVGLLPDSVEDIDTQLKRVLGHLAQKSTELERYLLLITLRNRNERLFHKILMSERIRFLLPSDSRRRLLEMWSHLRSVVRRADVDQSKGTSRAAA